MGNQFIDRVAVLGIMAIASAAAAGPQFRFNGAYFNRVNGSAVATESYDRINVIGQGDVRYDIFPPDYEVSVHMRATSGAGPGYVGTSTFTQFIKTFPNGGSFNWSINAGAFATMIFDDFVVTGPAGGVSAPIRFQLTGAMSGGASSANVTATVSLQVFFRINGTTGGGWQSIQYQGLDKFVSASGLLTGFAGAGVLQSDPIFVPTNTPFTVEVQLQSGSVASMHYSFSGNASANTDFAHTLKFATDRPVFNLPPGYSLNSAQAHITNNIFTPPCPADMTLDYQVDDADFVVFVSQYDTLDCADPAMIVGCPADLSNDGYVDDADFVIFLAAYNQLLCE
ncbi:MAG: hypothetical protein JSS51_14765 [Planctomycetes bacterium]|nr:hypothetical protein [Planctomycetota bacterium]